LRVPRSNLQVVADQSHLPATTVMLRHIPCRYNQGDMLRELDQIGFVNSYDFFYLPMDMQNKTSVGYAFINFVTPSDAERFFAKMQEYRFQRHPSDKVAEPSWAHIQGLRNNVQHLAYRTVLRTRDTKYRPIVLQKGFKRDFGELLAEFAAADADALSVNQGHATRSDTTASSNTSFTQRGGSGVLNPAAVEFVPCMPDIMKSVPLVHSSSVLNPMAKEFRPLETAVPKCTREELQLPLQQCSGPLRVPDENRCMTQSQDTEPWTITALTGARQDLEDNLAILLTKNCFMFEQSQSATACGVEEDSSLCFLEGFDLPDRDVQLQNACWVRDAFRALVEDLPAAPRSRRKCWV